MKKYQTKLMAGAAVAAVLVLAFWWGGNAPGLHGWDPSPQTAVSDSGVQPAVTPDIVPKAADVLPVQEGPLQEERQADAEAGSPADDNMTPPARQKADDAQQTAGSANGSMAGKQEGASYPQAEQQQPDNAMQSQPAASPEPDASPAPIAPQAVTITDQAKTCTLSVRCDTALNHLSALVPEKQGIVPSDGILFPEQTVTFYEGETVFHLLLREMKKHNIHMEYENTPLFNSAFIEGIGNLYELDCGELSGWMYRVNGWFPNYGCSRYQLRDGDRVEWVYTCDLGADVGGSYSAGQQRG